MADTTINFNREQLKLIIYGVWLTKKRPSRALELLKKSEIEFCLTKRTVQRYFKEFKNKEFIFETKPRSGRPKTATTLTNIGRIRELITTTRKITIRKMSKASGVKRMAVWRMIKSKLTGKKLRPCKNPHKLTEEMKRNRENGVKKGSNSSKEIRIIS